MIKIFMFNEISIGQLLSFIINNVPSDIVASEINDPDIRKYYADLKKRFNELKQQPELLMDIINAVPKQICPSHRPFLQNNDDYFIAFSLLTDRQELNVNNAGDFIHHLNNCYWCFTLYHKFIKDLQNTSKEYKEKTGV